MYTGPTCRGVDIAAGGLAFFYFGAFSSGDFVRAMTIQIADAVHTAGGNFDVALSEFDSHVAPPLSAAGFLTGHPLLIGPSDGGRLEGHVIYPADFLSYLVLPINRLVVSPETKFFGVAIQSNEIGGAIDGIVSIDAVPAVLYRSVEAGGRVGANLSAVPGLVRTGHSGSSGPSGPGT